MKILMISEFFPVGKDLKFSGGVEARSFYVSKELAKRHKVTIITRRVEKARVKENLYGLRILRVGPSKKTSSSSSDILGRIQFIKSAIKEAKSVDPDLVEGSNFVTHFVAASIAKTKKIPSVAWYPDVWVGSWVNNIGIFGLIGEVLERSNLKRKFSAYIAISNQTATKLKRKVKGKIYVIYCGVDPEEFSKNIKKSEQPTIVTISRLTSYKNINTLIYAFAHLTTKIKNVKLKIIGSGPEKNSLQSLVKSLNLQGKIEFYSNLPRKDVIKIISSSHVFSLPSLVEGFGIATIEAASAGLPYVNSNIPIQIEITKNGKGGFLVDTKSPTSYSEKFFKLLTNKKLYMQKSKEAKELAKEYNWKQVTRETERVYKKLQ